MLQLTMILAVLTAADVANVTPVLKLQAVPEDNEDFLQSPSDICFSADGQVFVLDTAAKRVFVWDENGHFRKTFGREGSAPGEFVFNGRRGRGPGSGFIGTLGPDLYIYDGAKQEISIYDAAEHHFKQAIPYSLSRGRAMGFAPIGADRFLIYRRAIKETGMTASAALFDRAAKPLVTLTEYEVTDFKVSGDRRERRFHRLAFAPATVVYYDAASETIVVGDGESASFSLFDKQGKNQKKLTFKIPRKEVTKEDVAEFNSQESIQNNNRVTVSFPEYKAFYDQILTVGREGYLVFTASPVRRLLDGWLIDNQVNVKGRFSYECGENGGLFGDRGRLLAVRTDKDGEYTMEELHFAL